MEMTKLSRNYSGSCQGNSQNRAFDGLLRSPVSLFRLILHCLLCIAAVTLGYRLSREAHFVIVSYKPPHSSFFLKHVINLNNTGAPNEVALGFPYARDNPKGFTPSLPPSVGLKSSRVHVGRHEILIRSWPHPDPVQTMVAHRLMDLVQDEQRRIYGLKERKQLLVVTPTYVRTFQAVHLTCLIHTLQVVAGPLIWIVVEAGGVSNETAALLSSSQLSYHHLGIQEAMPVDWEHRQQLKTRLRLEGLRLIREHCLDGIVLFADDSNTYSLDFFDEVQKVDWVGTFSVGLLFYSGLPESSKGVIELPHVHTIVSNETNNQLTHDHLSVAKETDVQLKYDDPNVAKKKSVSRLPPLPLQGPACNLSGHVIGWYAPSKDGHEQEIGTERSFEWAGIALNARMFWEENNTPTWVRSWNELLGVNGTLLESPLAFVKNAAHVEPLGNCGRDVLMWCLHVEAGTSSKFPARWVINPPLDIVVPSKRTPWPDAPVGVPPPPPPVLLPSDTTNQRGKGRRKGAKGGRRKQGAHHAKQVKGKMEAEQAFQFLGNRTQEK